MLLDILIPTYNRQDYLVYNLQSLAKDISALNAERDVRIVVRDNYSHDGTEKLVKQSVIDFPKIKFHYLRNDSNIGLKKNILTILSDADADYVMFLGDDDFLNLNYLKSVLLNIKSGTAFILPLRKTLALNKNLLSIFHNEEEVVQRNFTDGFINRVRYSAQCNQLSGLVYLNKGIRERAASSKINNIYPFMAFAAWALENGRGCIIMNNPVLVTVGNHKDWGYGKDGLLGDIIDNVKFIEQSYLKRVVGELMYTWIWNDRLAINFVRGFGTGIEALKVLFRDNRILFSTKLFLPVISVYLLLKISYSKWRGTFYSPHVVQSNSNVKGDGLLQ